MDTHTPRDTPRQIHRDTQRQTYTYTPRYTRKHRETHRDLDGHRDTQTHPDRHTQQALFLSLFSGKLHFLPCLPSSSLPLMNIYEAPLYAGPCSRWHRVGLIKNQEGHMDMQEKYFSRGNSQCKGLSCPPSSPIPSRPPALTQAIWNERKYGESGPRRIPLPQLAWLSSIP